MPGETVPGAVVDSARVLGSVLLSLGLVAGACGRPLIGTDRAAAPDVGVRWSVPTDARAEISYSIFNQGAADAYAVIVEARTARGPLRIAQRIEPGPRAGETLRRTEALTVTAGMRELCVTVRLQNLLADAPLDRDLSNNEICRPLPSRGETVAEAGR